VKAAVTVAGSDLAKEATDRYAFLTLEQAAAVAEFEKDGDAVKRLVVAAQAGEGRFEHVLAGLRDDREEQAAIDKLATGLAARGVRVVDEPRYSDPTKSLVLIRKENPTLTDQAHETCPGHAAYVTSYFEYDDDESETGKWMAEVNWACDDPVANGHLQAKGSAAAANVAVDTAEQDAREEAAREQRRLVVANNKAWRTAETVRREWLTKLLARKSAPKGAMRFVLAEMVKHDSHLSYEMERRHPTACELLGVAQVPTRWERSIDGESRPETVADVLARASDARAEVIALGLVLGAHESTLGTNAWRQPSERHAAYLCKLVEWGYELSEIEQSVVEGSS
jgi:ParB family chromosome partitioning protein